MQRKAYTPLDNIYLNPNSGTSNVPERTFITAIFQEQFQNEIAGSNNVFIQSYIDELKSNGLDKHILVEDMKPYQGFKATNDSESNQIIAALKYLKKEFEENGVKAIGNLESHIFNAIPIESFKLYPFASPDFEKFVKSFNDSQKVVLVPSFKNIKIPQYTPTNILFNNTDTQHLIDLNILAYKSLSGISINHLNKINLFAGENNSGKTSLLEAVRLLVAQNDANDFLHIQQLRGKFSEEKLMPFWVIDTVRDTIQIEGHFGKQDSLTKIEIQPGVEDDDTLNGADYLGSFHFQGAFMDKNHSTNLRLFETKNYNLSIKGKTNHLCKFAYYSPFGGHRTSQLYNAHAESIEKNHLPKVITFLQASIDENIVNIRLVEKNGLKRFLVEHKNFEQAVDLIQFGDGLQNIFRTTILFSIAENGIILIDEMETAIHHSLLIAYTKFIQQLSEKFNTQVFITSHSGECIDAFVDNGYRNDEISMYNMEVEGGQVFCRHITGNRYKELNDLMGIDLRD